MHPFKNRKKKKKSIKGFTHLANAYRTKRYLPVSDPNSPFNYLYVESGSPVETGRYSFIISHLSVLNLMQANVPSLK